MVYRGNALPVAHSCMGGKRLSGFVGVYLFAAVLIFSIFESVRFAAVLAHQLVGCNCRCFSGYIHIRYLLALFPWAVWKLEKKETSDCHGLPTAAQISPPPPHAHIYSIWGRGSTSWEIIWVGKLSPHLLQESVTFDGPPPPPTPSWEEPAGVLEIRTGYLKIDSVGIFFRKIPAFPRTCYTPSPSPPSCHGGGGMKRGVYCTAFPILKGNYIELSNFGIYHMND
jgi:hypothetical protein